MKSKREELSDKDERSKDIMRPYALAKAYMAGVLVVGGFGTWTLLLVDYTLRNNHDESVIKNNPSKQIERAEGIYFNTYASH